MSHIERLAATYIFSTVISIGACADHSLPREAVTVTDSAGISIVKSYSARWDTGVAWTVAEEPILRIGAVEGGNPAERFTRIRDLTRLADGRIVVLEGTTNQIRWFSFQGEHIVTRGGRGAGPGEFNSATSMGVFGGDSIFVQDAPRIKQVLFGPSGEFVREEVLEVDRYNQFGPWMECLRYTLPDRSLVGCQPEDGLQSGFVQRPGLQRTFSRFVRVPWELDAEYPLGLYGGLEQWGYHTSDGTLRYVLHPHYSHTVVGTGGEPLRVAIALNPKYSIEVWHPNGHLERIVRRAHARRPVSPADRARALEQLRDSPFGVPGNMFDRVMAEVAHPDSLPAVSRLTIDADGGIWVSRPTISPDEPVQVDVFGVDGSFLGAVSLPPRFQLFEVGSDYILGVRLNSVDVPFVEMYELTRTE